MPLGWADNATDEHWLWHAAKQLVKIARFLKHLEEKTGRLIHLDLEPEPGCLLQQTEDVLLFFKEYLFQLENQSWLSRYLRVCHDICHSAVMFEDQATVLEHYQQSGILLGKVQISSAIALPFYHWDENQRQLALEELAQFNEQRYLHQTTFTKPKQKTEHAALYFYEDLTPALQYLNENDLSELEARVHFHVPLFLERIGLLKTTQDQIKHALPLLTKNSHLKHYELETYAWNVLPHYENSSTHLTDNIAKEINWFTSLFKQLQNE